MAASTDALDITSAPEQAMGKPWYRQFWPWFIIALPAATVVASFVTIWLAVTRPDAIVKEPTASETAYQPYRDVRSAYPEAGVARGEAAAAAAASTNSDERSPPRR